ELGEKAWFMDDEKVAYPFWERTKKLGVKNLCVHKGLPLGAFNEKACTPLDLEKAAKDWPDLNFIVYHAGFRGFGRLGGGTAASGGGSPKRQMKRLRRLKMTPELMDKYKYPALTDEIKAQIFGLNAAQLFGIDPKAKRKEIKADKLTQLREQYQQDPAPS